MHSDTGKGARHPARARHFNARRFNARRFNTDFTAMGVVRARPALAALAPLIRQGAPVALGLGCLYLLSLRLDGIDWRALGAAVARIGALEWALAALFTIGSFWALGRYDIVVHRQLRTGIDGVQAARAGILAIALSQTVGMGVITGAFARWRALPGLGLGRATQIAALVAVSFLAGWAVVAAAALAVFPQPGLAGGSRVLPLLALAGLALIPLAALLGPDLRIRGRRVALPPLPAMGAIVWWTLIDTACAAAALMVLMPSGLGLGFADLFPVYLLALGAALLSGTPGGVGPFELALFALLPGLPEAELMVGILAFRLIYYALPALVAAGWLLRPAGTRRAHLPRRSRLLYPAAPRLYDNAPRAELGVARQNGGRVLMAPAACGVAAETGQTLTLLFDPAEGRMQDLIPTLTDEARAMGRIPTLYKCSARSALAARQAGWALWRVADEAVIDPARFAPEGKAFRQLRRKLGQFARSGAEIARAARLPVTEMARIDAEWQARQGRARGWSMGRFDPHYLEHHRVYLAWRDGRLLGFVSFHAAGAELTLDLMRSGAEAPEGMMQALILAAIRDAAREGRRRLSLAAVPALARSRPTTPAGRAEAWSRARIHKAGNGPGLHRFKDSFAPRWEPLYLAAPSLPALALAAADLGLAVNGRAPSMRSNPPAPHHPHEDFAAQPS